MPMHSVARQEFEQRSESLLGAADRRRMTAAGVRTHIENNVFKFERHGATGRCAALRFASGVRPPSPSQQLFTPLLSNGGKMHNIALCTFIFTFLNRSFCL